MGSGCGILSPHAVTVADDIAAWMGHGSFFRYSGGTVSALPSEVSDFVYQGMNTAQAEKVFAYTNSAFGEMWWFYPSASALECDRYVIWNYRENTWSIGAMNRTAAVDRGAFNFPLAVGTDGYIYEHEVGHSYGGAEVYCVSGPVEIQEGERVMMLKKIIPDERNLGDVRATFASRFWPMDGVQEFGPFTLSKETDIRFTGRQIAVRLSAVNQNEWRVGNFRFDAVPASRR